MTPAPPILTIQFNPPMPAWLVAGLGVAAIVAAVYFYRRQSSPPAGEISHRILILLRALAVVIAFVMMLAPAGVWSSQHRSRGRLYLILDDTRSMSRIDPPNSGTRAALAQDALRQLRPTLDEFDVTLVPLTRPLPFTPPSDRWFETALAVLQAPQAAATPIGQSLEAVADDSDDPATILLLSDGRQNDGPLPEPVAHRLASRGSRLFTLSVGSPDPVRDAAVDSVDAPSYVLAGDDLNVSATLRLDAIANPVTVRLFRDGTQIAAKTVSAAPTARVEFLDPAPPAGDHTYTVAIHPVPAEATTRNNQLSTTVSVRRQKIRVLLIDDEPRWEFQFLKTLLRTDRTVDLSTRLIEQARVANIPSPPPEPLPESAQAWAAFDVVILGDISPATFTRNIQSDLSAALRQGTPTSLILIAGPRNLPSRYAATPIADVLPIDLTAPPAPRPDTAQGLVPRFAPDALSSTLVRLFSDDQQNRAFWSAVPPFFWCDDHITPKPAAQVLWETAPENPTQPRIPLLSQIRYGSSRILYSATPETWRLRYVQSPTGQLADLHRRFWTQALRWSIAGDAARSDSQDRDVEDLNQSANPALLAALAKNGNGASFDASDTKKLVAALPTTAQLQTRTTRLGLFDDPSKRSTRYLHGAVYLAFVIVLSTEWIVRKRRGMV